MVDKVLENECTKCDSIQPPHTDHCKKCNRCVPYMDHHCPWINNCVGLFTLKPFMLFTFYSTSLILYAIIIIVEPTWDELKNNQNFSPALSMLLSTLIACLVFFLFTLTILIDQLTIVANR